MLDQPSNALRLVEAGCAVAPLPFAKMTAPVRWRSRRGGAGPPWRACRAPSVLPAHLQTLYCAVACSPFPTTKQALAGRVAAALGDPALAARAAAVAAEVRSGEWRGVAAAADAVLSSGSPWAGLRAEGVIR
jgi:hypothetical protein